MGRTRPKTQPEAVILPPELDDDDEGNAGGGIPDDDGWIHLEGKDAKREEEKQRPARRRSRSNGKRPPRQ
jgi:hypothetical protein